MSGHGESASSVTLYKKCIPRKKKWKKTSYTLIRRGGIIQEPESPSKR